MPWHGEPEEDLYRESMPEPLRLTNAEAEHWQHRAESAEAEVAHLRERERYFAKVLGVADGGQYRNDWDVKLAEILAEVAHLRELVHDLIDPGECWFDHHGYCQEHGWMETEPPCPHARAKEALR